MNKIINKIFFFFLKIILHYLLPKSLLTNIMKKIAEYHNNFFTFLSIIFFIRMYKIDMKDVKQKNIRSYHNFNEFFIRKLSSRSRPINFNPNVLVFPADGVITQFGHILNDKMLQAKGISYSLNKLLAEDKEMISLFQNGQFVTTYLSPKDYHRVHMPCDGILEKVIYVPGKLFSVNPLAVKNIPDLFTKNKRVICLFDTEFGPIVQILIGAIIVGSIEMIWNKDISISYNKEIKQWSYINYELSKKILLLKGEEMGLFKIGSTVINLFVKNNILLNNNLFVGYIARIGQYLAYKNQKFRLIS